MAQAHPPLVILVRKRIGYKGKYALIVPDHAAGRRHRYTVYIIPATPAKRVKIVGRELPLGQAKRVALNKL